MRLFHVSEEENIEIFEPRIPTRQDLDQTVGLVWTIDEARLANFLTPRECPRVCYYRTDKTSKEDVERFFTSSSMNHVVIIEKDWYQRMLDTTLYIYEFESAHFELLDDVAGYYVSKRTEKPIAKFQINDLMKELINRNVEVRIVDCLWEIATDLQNSTLNWSLCKMANAKR